ncbi:MAG: 1-deoxy-D-xylulose-5-phosphate synthase [Armatimonadetes bacterium OLB18]|nr:MAG: 1-deoxy-D-xylulose-5-phosphate synthase [Armatimonadetes bacterium OLB18]
MVGPAWAAAQQLGQEGIDAAVVNARWIKPLDEEAILDLASVSGRILTVEENVRTGGFGEGVRTLLAENGLAGLPLRSLTLPDQFIEHGAQPLIRGDCGLDAKGIVGAVLELLDQSSGYATYR